MSKNTKKKNAIRFGALAVAALLFLGVFSAWAQGADAQASAEIGEIEVDGIHVTDEADGILLEGSIAGRPGTVNADEESPYSLFEISEDEDEALTGYEYIATVYLTNGAELVEEGVRSLTLEIQLDDGDDDTNGLTETAVLTLDSGQASFTFEWDPPADETIDVDIIGGSWATYPFADFGGTAEDTVDFMIDIEPTRDMSE